MRGIAAGCWAGARAPPRDEGDDPQAHRTSCAGREPLGYGVQLLAPHGTTRTTTRAPYRTTTELPTGPPTLTPRAASAASAPLEPAARRHYLGDPFGRRSCPHPPVPPSLSAIPGLPAPQRLAQPLPLAGSPSRVRGGAGRSGELARPRWVPGGGGRGGTRGQRWRCHPGAARGRRRAPAAALPGAGPAPGGRAGGCGLGPAGLSRAGSGPSGLVAAVGGSP